MGQSDCIRMDVNYWVGHLRENLDAIDRTKYLKRGDPYPKRQFPFARQPVKLRGLGHKDWRLLLALCDMAHTAAVRHAQNAAVLFGRDLSTEAVAYVLHKIYHESTGTATVAAKAAEGFYRYSDNPVTSAHVTIARADVAGLRHRVAASFPALRIWERSAGQEVRLQARVPGLDCGPAFVLRDEDFYVGQRRQPVKVLPGGKPDYPDHLRPLVDP